MAAVTDDEVRSLLRGTRLGEEALFGNSDFGARTLAALGVLPQDLFDANERGRQKVGAGVFWLAFKSPDDAADARPLVFPDTWPQRADTAICFPLDGEARWSMPFVALRVARQLRYTRVPKDKQRLAVTVCFHIQITNGPSAACDEAIYRTVPLYVLRPAESPMRPKQPPTPMSAEQKRLFCASRVSQWLNMTSQQLLQETLGEACLRNLQSLRETWRQAGLGHSDADRRREALAGWGFPEETLELDTEALPRFMMWLLSRGGEGEDAVRQLLLELKALQRPEVRQRMKQAKKAAQRYAATRLRELEEGLGLSLLCYRCAGPRPSGGYRCPCEKEARPHGGPVPATAPPAASPRAASPPRGAAEKDVALANERAALERKSRRSGGLLQPSLPGAAPAAAAAGERRAEDAAAAAPAGPAVAPGPDGGDDARERRRQGFARKRAAKQDRAALAEAAADPALARAAALAREACLKGESKIVGAASVEGVEKTMLRLLGGHERRRSRHGKQLLREKSRVPTAVVKQLFFSEP
jgi:hypothetical protein